MWIVLAPVANHWYIYRKSRRNRSPSNYVQEMEAHKKSLIKCKRQALTGRCKKLLTVAAKSSHHTQTNTMKVDTPYINWPGSLLEKAMYHPYLFCNTT